ncbi:MAG: hypothetical protein HQL76_00435 [Magnetococcales bacterium]|nr:hypothetical protein [Magnetococcales bacterium]
MNASLVIEPRWLTPDHGSDPICHTSAHLYVRVNGHLATKVFNDWTRTVEESVPLSAYPLALWLVSSWWRLHWESLSEQRSDVGWRLAHEMRGAGHGFLWPPLRFEPDGAMVTVRCTPPDLDVPEPIRYLNRFVTSMPVAGFTEGIATFIQTVIDRLEDSGIRETPLRMLWREVTGERVDPETAAYRRMEALLGWESDEAPDDVMDDFQGLSLEAGPEAVIEVAAACAGMRPGELLKGIRRGTADTSGVPVRLSELFKLRDELSGMPGAADPPWKRGWDWAQASHRRLGLDSRPVTSGCLTQIMEFTERELNGKEAPMAGAPLGLAIKGEGEQRSRLFFRSKSCTERRFEVARWMGDALMAPSGDRWLPATDAKTARQKMQRAFAAEFLVPIEALKEFLGGALADEERIEEAGEHFSVSPLTIRSHLANHRLVPWPDNYL